MTKKEIELLRNLRNADVDAYYAATDDADTYAAAEVATAAAADYADGDDASEEFKNGFNGYQDEPTYKTGIVALDKILEKYND